MSMKIRSFCDFLVKKIKEEVSFSNYYSEEKIEDNVIDAIYEALVEYSKNEKD